MIRNIYRFSLYILTNVAIMFAFLPNVSSAMSQEEWNEYSKLTKTIEGRLEWVFPSPTEYLCAENKGIGVWYDFTSKDVRIQKNAYGNVFLTFSEKGKKLTHKPLSDKFGEEFVWSQIVNTEVQTENSDLIPIYLNDISNPNIIYQRHRILVVDLQGCEADSEIFRVRQPDKICVKAFETFFDAISTYMLDCSKNN